MNTPASIQGPIVSDTPENIDNASSQGPNEPVAQSGVSEEETGGSEAALPPSLERQPLPWRMPHSLQEGLLFDSRNAGVHREDSLGNHWSVPWSDLMMVMFILFAALVTAQLMQQQVPEFIDRDKIVTVDKEKIVRQELTVPTPSFESLMRINVFEKSQDAVRESNIENVDIVLMDDNSVKVSVQGPMFFDLGEDKLKPDVRIFLNALASVIRQTSYKVNVIGHTDDNPINTDRFPSNWELSLLRATQVARHLIEAGQVDPARFTIMGRSQYEPATPNTNEQSRSLNRRVEIIVTRENAETAEDPS